MSEIKVRDQRARALLRLARISQIAALAPFPERPALNPWNFTRRGFLHGAGESGAGFAVGVDSNTLRRLKMGLKAEGVERAVIDSLDEGDVAIDAGGVTVTPRGAAKIPAPIAVKLRTEARPLELKRGYNVKVAQHRERAAANAALLAAYEDSGFGDVAQLRIVAPGGSPVSNITTIQPPVRLTHIYVSMVLSVAPNSSYEWSVNPPGVGDAETGDALNGATMVLENGTNLTIPCDVTVLNQAVILAGRISVPGVAADSSMLLAVSYRHLRRKA